jgi:uncharacterized cupredoxin-like copper-binding protein
MKTLLVTTTSLVLTATLAWASGNHAGGHGSAPKQEETHGHTDGHAHGHDDGRMAEMMAVGTPGEPGTVSRTVDIRMFETDGGDMRFDPADLRFHPGETVRLRLRNDGEFDHEFVMDTVENNEKHRELIQKFPEMEHDGPNAVRLAPGETGEIVWTFANPGAFQFACLIPGHMELGMHGPIAVSAN